MLPLQQVTGRQSRGPCLPGLTGPKDELTPWRCVQGIQSNGHFLNRKATGSDLTRRRMSHHPPGSGRPPWLSWEGDGAHLYGQVSLTNPGGSGLPPPPPPPGLCREGWDQGLCAGAGGCPHWALVPSGGRMSPNCPSRHGGTQGPPPRPLGLPRGHIVGQSEGRCRHTDRRHHSAGREGNTRLLPSPRAGRRRSSSPHGPATHPREVVPSGATAATGQSQGRGRQRSAPPGGTGRGRGRGRGGGGGRGVADTLQGSVC